MKRTAECTSLTKLQLRFSPANISIPSAIFMVTSALDANQPYARPMAAGVFAGKPAETNPAPPQGCCKLPIALNIEPGKGGIADARFPPVDGISEKGCGPKSCGMRDAKLGRPAACPLPAQPAGKPMGIPGIAVPGVGLRFGCGNGI